MFLRRLIHCSSDDIHVKFLRRSSQGNTPPSGELKTFKRGVANSDFGLSEAISRKRCKIGGKLMKRGKNPQWTKCICNYRRMHCACTKRPYFRIRSKIWRHYRIPRLWFPKRSVNFGDSRAFKADIGLRIFACVFRTSWSKMFFFGGGANRGIQGW